MVQWRRGRQSSNVEDRRGTRVRKGAVGGGVGLLIMIIVAWLLGVDPRQILQIAESAGPATTESYEPTAEENRTAEFVSAMLADTEDTWNAIFADRGWEFREPTLVLFTGATESACGFAGAAVGPFYCPRDEQIYIDVSFFQDLAERFGAPGDFARAYVVAHEVGHHVQTLRGISSQVREEQQRAPSRANELQVRMELQADCLAGVWAYHANQNRSAGEIRLEPGDVEEGLRAAAAIGDDRLQRRTQGYVVPESFTHGSSAQRVEWLRRGMQDGTLGACDTSAG